MSDPLLDLERVAPTLEAAAKGVRLGDRAEQLLRTFADLERQTRRFAALVTLGAHLHAQADVHIRQSGDKCLAAAQEAAEAIAEVADEEDLTIAAECHQAFANALAAFDASVRASWAQRVDGDFAQLGSVGALLAGFPGAKDLGERMQQAARDAAVARQGATAEQLVAIAADLLARREALIAEQQTVAGDPAVAAFLQALAEKRATLDLLKPEVLKWLGDQKALDRLQVVAQ